MSDPDLPGGAWAAIGAGVSGIVVALWKAFMASAAARIAVAEAERDRERQAKEALGKRLDATTAKLIEALTWIRARDPAAQWEELPSKVQSVMDATKDPFPELRGWDPALKTPTGAPGQKTST